MINNPYYSDNKQYEYYYDNNGMYHREGAPAVIDHLLYIVYYYKHGELHRLDGPAIKYVANPWYNEYWVNGKRLDNPADYQNTVNNLNKKKKNPRFSKLEIK